MKNINNKLKFSVGLVLSIATIFGLFAFVAPKDASAQYAVPTCNSATLNGHVETNGATTTVWFEWGVGSSITYSTPRQTFSSPSSFSAVLTNLSEGSTYSYRAMASNQNGSSTGQTLTFRTNTCTTTSVPTVNLSASPSSIQSGQSSTLSWNSTNANSCFASWTTSTGTSGSKVVFPSHTTTYSITCTNDSGSATDTATVHVGNVSINQPSVNLTADDTNIDSGDSTILRWSSSNADYCTASGGTNGWSGSRPLSGTFNTGSLTSDRTYSITCYNNEGNSANDSVTVRVSDDENDISVDLRADETSINSGDNTILRWSSDNADSCRGTGGRNGWAGSKPRSGSFNTGSLYDTTTYKIICENDHSSAEDDDSVTVRVVDSNICRDNSATNYLGSLPCRYQVNNQPTVVLTADSTNIAFNASTTIRWSTTNATSCIASGGSTGWAGPKSIGPGSFFTGSLTGSRTYVITCTNGVGSATDSVTVSVRGQVLGVATPASAYLVVNSSVDRNRPIVPTLDNTNPCPGDEINYTLTYQNVGNASVRNLVLRVDLPFEVSYLSSNPSNPTMSGNTLIFNLGTLGANKSGTVTVRVLVRDNVQAGTSLNFPATLNYVDPSGMSQSVSANVSANVCGTLAPLTDETVSLGATVFGAGFLPTSIFGWLLLLILILILILLAKYLFGQSFQKKTVTTYDPNLGKSTTTTTTL